MQENGRRSVLQERIAVSMGTSGLHRWKNIARWGEEGQKVMEQLYRTLQLSARVYHRILKTARTIADLEDRGRDHGEHLLEAACYRPSETYWN